ncbi:hypothetical protein HOLleu_15201 [Holothuria leucospilota]|uniref:Fibronectin type-III domain-containing protein n=1 Tax=Holothuria leucospilota TaxID=206669 RepID=A0A9Q1HCB3_HOLLE|nr:hypothetical protein HOLleu_15201 [Holothuria leucospilota]
MALTVEIITLLVFTFQETGLSATADEFAPSNVRFEAIDLNLTFKWSPPVAPLLDGENILYTVVRMQKKKANEVVRHCVNISETECHLLPLFDRVKDFGFKEIFFVTSISTVRSNYSGKSYPKGFTNRNVAASAPVVYNTSITTSNITVWIHGPETPFMKRGRNLFLVEEALQQGNFMLHHIYFNSSLTRDNVNDFKKTISEKKSSDGRAEIVYSNLLPYTNYTLKVQSLLNHKFSANVTTFKFQTRQKAPEVGPIVSGVEVKRRYCDFRDIKINWEESASQKPNVALTKYVIEAIDAVTSDTTNITVPASARSVLLRKLIRWHQYNITITSFNSGGRKEGEIETIEKDAYMTKSYKPTIKDIAEVSTFKRVVTWIPPKDHDQCIVGYIIEARSSEGFLAEKVYVVGFNTSSASLHLKKPGRYTIELRPKFNDSIGTNVSTTTAHDVKGPYKMPPDNALRTDLGHRKALIFGGLALLVTIISTGIGIMTKKVFCDTSDLPDLAKIKTMSFRGLRPPGSPPGALRRAPGPTRLKNHSGDDHPVRTVLRKPPEKEIFHATRSLPPNHHIPYSYSNYEDKDDVFQPKSSSTSVLLESRQSIDKDVPIVKKSHEFSSPPILDGAKDNQDQVIDSQKDEASCGLADDPPATVTHAEDKSWSPSLPDGYVAHSFTNKNSALKVYIRKVSESLSSDSGFSSSPNSQCDYVPQSPFANSSTFVYTVNPIPSHLEDSPYVKAEVAGRHGRIPSSSMASDVTGNCPRYNRIDSRQSLNDPYPKGYLTMNSSLPSQ